MTGPADAQGATMAQAEPTGRVAPAAGRGLGSISRLGAVSDASALVALIALIGFVGWARDFPAPSSLTLFFPTLMPSSLFLLGLVAIALRELRFGHRARMRYTVTLASAVIAFVSLTRLAVDLDFLDAQTESVLVGALFSTQSSPVTSLSYVLIALSMGLAAFDHPLARRVSGWCGAAVAGITLVSLCVMTVSLFGESRPLDLDMKFPVALALFAASTGLLSLRSADVIGQGDGDAPGLSVVRNLAPLAVVLPLAAVWLEGAGRGAGLLQRFEGVGVVVVTLVIASLTLIVWTGRKLDDMHDSRSRAEHRADTQQTWFEITLAHLGEAVITVDDQRRIGLLNPAAAALLGVDAGDVVGKRMEDLVPLVEGRTGVLLDYPLQQAFEAGAPVTLEGEPALRNASGRLQPIEITATPILDAEQRLVGGVLVLRDVSARRAREQAEREVFAALDRRVAERTRALDRTTTVLRESTELLRTIAETTPEQIIAKSRNGAIMMINPAALKLMGLSRAQVIGRREEDLFPDSADMRRIAQHDQEVMETGRPVVVEERRHTSAGERILLVTKSPLRDGRGEVVGLVGVSKDITERKRAHQELEQLLDAEHRLRGEAERASRAKDEFLAIVSHELRSPLNALKGWAQVLAGVSTPDPALLGRASDAIKRNVDHQVRLIDDLLSTSRIISGKLDLNCERINLVDVAASTLETFRVQAHEKGVALRFESEHAVVPVRADYDRMQQVLSNLLSNALKFTPEGGSVQVLLALTRDTVEMTVSDTGIGIKADFLPHVFDRFSQADTSMTRRYHGMGIGLALVRNLVELQGGSVRVRSDGEGQGAAFVVQLRRLQAHEHPCQPPPLLPPGRRLEGVKVLLLDDDADACDFMLLILSKAGARAHAVDSPDDLLAAFDDDPGATATVLLLDIAMPRESGFEVLRRVRQQWPARRVPAIAVSALSYLDDSLLKNSGFEALVSKPVDERELIDAIASVLDAQAAAKERTGTPG